MAKFVFSLDFNFQFFKFGGRRALPAAKFKKLPLNFESLENFL